MGQDTGAVTNPSKKPREINLLERRKSRPRIAKNPLRTDFDGYVVVADQEWPGMYRVRLPDGRLTDMVNLTRALDAAQVMAGKGVQEAAQSFACRGKLGSSDQTMEAD